MVLLAACSKDKAIDEPAKLTPFAATLRVEHLWGASVDNSKAVPLRLGQAVAVVNNRVYAAGHTGDVVAFDLNSGKVQWRARTKAPLSGGTAAGADVVMVGTVDGRVFALNATDGKLRWQVRINGEVLAPPAIPRSSSRAHGRWQVARPRAQRWSRAVGPGAAGAPPLAAWHRAPVISGDTVLCGFDNGKVMAVNSNDGSVQWEATVTPPHGRTELERLADIDSAVLVSGQNVYGVGFQGRVAMLALDTGQVWWSHELSSYRGMGLDDEALYVSTAEGEVVALRGKTGAEIWRQSVLLHRGLSAPASMDDVIVLGDFLGYVHWLDKASGAIAARVHAGKARISAPPVVVGNLVVVVTDRGQSTPTA